MITSLLFLILLHLTLAQNTTIPIFGLRDAPGGNDVYTAITSWGGSVLAVSPTATTFVVTSTYVQRNSAPARWTYYSKEGGPQTVTQGPSTWAYTSAYANPGMADTTTCTLYSTTEAWCNMTLATGFGMYYTMPFTWTLGNTAVGYAPVTISMGLEKLAASGTQSVPVQTGGANRLARMVGIPLVVALLTIGCVL